MPPPIATPRARALGFGMKRARQARNLKVRELGRLIDVLPQNISNWESGKRIPRIDELATILGALRVDPAERARLVNLARTATDPNWLDQHTVDGSERLATYLEYERAATTMVRLARRNLLTGRNPLSCGILLSESVLHQNIGGPAVMAEQLGYLRSRMRLPSVSVRIVPNGIGYHPGHFGPFIIFDYADLPSIVYLEHHRGSGYVYDEHDVAGYRAAIKMISSLALSEHDSDQLIQGVITGLEA